MIVLQVIAIGVSLPASLWGMTRIIVALKEVTEAMNDETPERITITWEDLV